MPFPHLEALATLHVLAAAKKSSSGSAVFLIFIVIILGVYLLFIAPQRRRQRAQMSQQRTFEIGDDVITTGGIYGRVEHIDGDRVALDIADGVIIEVARTSIARTVQPVVSDTETSEPAWPDTPADGGHDWSPPNEEPSDSPGSSASGDEGHGGSSSGAWADPWSAPKDGNEGGDASPGGTS